MGMRKILVTDKSRQVAEYVTGLLPKGYFEDVCLLYSQKGALNAIARNMEISMLLTGMELEDGSGPDLCKLIRNTHKYGYEKAFEKVIPEGETPANLSDNQRDEILDVQIKLYAEDFFDGDYQKATVLFLKRAMPIVLMQDTREYREHQFSVDRTTGFSGIVRGKPELKDGQPHYDFSSPEGDFRKKLEFEINRLTRFLH